MTGLRLICQRCEGEGRILGESGLLELCPTCLGIGYYESGKEDEGLLAYLESRKPVMRAIYILVAAMAIFYVVYILLDRAYSFPLYAGILILLAGHTIGVGGFFVYLLWGILNKKEGF